MERKNEFIWPESLPKQAVNTLENFLRSKDFVENFPQAFLLLGPVQTGKELALSFSAHITGLKYPNIDTLEFDASGPDNIESMRELIKLASLKPVQSNRKIVILNNLERANHQVLNSLLKSLEEPPAHVVFLLISPRPLLPTVMSRCQVVSFVSGANSEKTEEVTKVLDMLESNRSSGVAEKLSLVSTLASLEDELLDDVMQQWIIKQTAELQIKPQNYKAVRVTMETIQSLRKNFNKKMVLQNFLTNALI